MLSIIICSIKENLFQLVSQNIEETIGAISYEIIRINNLKEQLPITQAYNKGAAKAQYNNLLFVHEDVAFQTQNWGEILCSVLKLNNIGVVGLAGSIKKFKQPIGYYSGIPQYDYIQVRSEKHPTVNAKSSKNLIPVRVLDGVFLASTRDVWQQYKFDNQLNGFHFYDIDYSIRVSKDLQNYIITTIQLEHFSAGSFDDKWIDASISFHKKDYDFDIPNAEELKQIREFWYSRLWYENINYSHRVMFIKALGIGEFKDAIQFLLGKNRFYQKIFKKG